MRMGQIEGRSMFNVRISIKKRRVPVRIRKVAAK